MLEDLKRVDQSILWRDWMHNSFHFFRDPIWSRTGMVGKINQMILSLRGLYLPPTPAFRKTK